MLNFAQKMALSNKLSNKTNKNFTKKILRTRKNPQHFLFV